MLGVAEKGKHKTLQLPLSVFLKNHTAIIMADGIPMTDKHKTTIITITQQVTAVGNK